MKIEYVHEEMVSRLRKPGEDILEMMSAERWAAAINHCPEAQ